MIREFKKKDSVSVGKLICKTFNKYNYSEYFLISAIENYLNYYNPKKGEDKLYYDFKKSPIKFVYLYNKEIIGFVRGNENRIIGLYVFGKYHRKSIGTKLIEKFEKEAIKKESKFIKVRASLYAIPFYTAKGYKKTTRIVNFKNLKVQPMIKRF